MLSKPLIIYYSKTGTTAKIVETVRPLIMAETIRLGEPKNWTNRLKLLRNFREDNETKEPTGIIDKFDPIIFMTPVWKGKPTLAMIEFLEKIDLKNKRVVLGLVGANETNPDALSP